MSHFLPTWFSKWPTSWTKTLGNELNPTVMLAPWNILWAPYLAHNRASQPQYCWLREILWTPTSPITVPANHRIAGSVKCYGPRPSRLSCQPTTVLLASWNVTDPDLAHNRASKPQYCWLREMLRAPTSPITVPANHNIAGSVKCYGHRRRP